MASRFEDDSVFDDQGVLRPGAVARVKMTARDSALRPFPAESMRMWPISTRVNKPENDDPSIVEPIEAHVATCAAVETVGLSIWNRRLARRW